MTDTSSAITVRSESLCTGINYFLAVQLSLGNQRVLKEYCTRYASATRIAMRQQLQRHALLMLLCLICSEFSDETMHGSERKRGYTKFDHECALAVQS